MTCGGHWEGKGFLVALAIGTAGRLALLLVGVLKNTRIFSRRRRSAGLVVDISRVGLRGAGH